MNTIKVIVRKFTTKKEGKEFYTLRAKGKYLPLALADEETDYNVRLCGSVTLPKDAKEGIYEVAFESGKLWIDDRFEMLDKNIVRCKATRIVFHKPLPVFAKEVATDVIIDKEAK